MMGIFLIFFIFFPRIDVFPRVHDVGKIYEGELIREVFKIVNTGDDTLKIEKVGTTCYCTAALLDRDYVIKGDTLKMLVTVDTKNREGEIEEQIFVKTNDPYEPVVRLKVIATVIPKPKPEIETPEVVNAGFLYVGETVNIPLTIKNPGLADLIIPRVVSSLSCDVIADFPLVVPPGKKKIVTLQIKPFKPGVLNEEIRLVTNIRYYPYHRIKVTGTVRKSSSVVFLPFVFDKINDTLYLINQTQNPLYIENLSITDDIVINSSKIAPKGTLKVFIPIEKLPKKGEIKLNLRLPYEKE